jgi:hypothetical protein
MISTQLVRQSDLAKKPQSILIMKELTKLLRAISESPTIKLFNMYEWHNDFTVDLGSNLH